MDQHKQKILCIIKNDKFINLKYNFYVLAYNRAKIDKQCEHCSKLE